jgi:hypothetical protein
MIRVDPVTSKKQLATLLIFHTTYTREILIMFLKFLLAKGTLLTPGKHPFHEHSFMQLFLAKDENGKIQGRIACYPQHQLQRIP